MKLVTTPHVPTTKKVAGKRLAHLFPALPGQSGYFKRRRRLVDTIEWLLGVFASQSPGDPHDRLRHTA